MDTKFEIKAYEGARGTCSRLYERDNCRIKEVEGSNLDTIYGWEAVEYPDPINCKLPSACLWHVAHTDGGQREIIIIHPEHGVYGYTLGGGGWCYRDNRFGHLTSREVPRPVREYLKRFL